MENKSIGPIGRGPIPGSNTGLTGGSNKAAAPDTTKSYGRANSAESAIRIGPPLNPGSLPSLTIHSMKTIKKWKENINTPQRVLRPPWFKAYMLFDGDSQGLIDFFTFHIPHIGKASGDLIHFIDIGDPEQGDGLYEMMRTQRLKSYDDQASKEYEEQLTKIKIEKLYQLKEMMRLSEWMGFQLSDLPCIAFTTWPPWHPPSVLKIKSAYYAPDERRNVFGRVLQDCLFRMDRDFSVTPGVMNSELMKRFDTELTKIVDEIDHEVGIASSGLVIPSLPGIFCNIVTKDGSRHSTQVEYNKILDIREKVGMFIDGVTFQAWKYEKGRPRGPFKLQPAEFEMIAAYMLQKKIMTPYVGTGMKANSEDAARQTFEDARKIVDTCGDDGEYRVFRMRRGRSASETAFYFNPPQDFNYCLIVPVVKTK
jgi:hypothetical protein